MNPENFKKVVLPLRRNLFQTAFRMLEEAQDSEDIVQEVFLRLWHMRESLERYENLSAFASTITKNLCIDKIRTRGRMTTLEEDIFGQATTDNPYLLLEKKDTNELLHQIIEQLPPLQRAIIKMKDIEEYEVEEIAEITGSQVEAIRMNLSRARKKVRETFVRITSC